ncbi:hypothetical protein E2C01_003880 [Portunus trituberculatus]|uniref:Uncharacterized protein n=1 Tax=Portunus trituberculatus TaxID=210409 RepID=A0A5B7CPY9_PORTR|nr:hypothetical protein [Portunus trituberculatus]
MTPPGTGVVGAPRHPQTKASEAYNEGSSTKMNEVLRSWVPPPICKQMPGCAGLPLGHCAQGPSPPASHNPPAAPPPSYWPAVTERPGKCGSDGED